MKTNNKKVIIWLTEIMDLIEEKPIGGIAVQMYFWSQIFAKKGWQVHSFAMDIKETIERSNIIFTPKRNIRYINFFLEWWYAFKYIYSIRPKVIIFRGAHRVLLPLSIFAKLFNTKLVFFSASDVNFEPGKELVGSKFNRKLYQYSIRHIEYFVTQNQFQHDTLFNNYSKNSLIMFNIWGETPQIKNTLQFKRDVVWVANFRRLKRAEWVINVADKMPNHFFVLAGGCSDESYYNDMKNRSENESNIRFLGGISFSYSNQLIAGAKVLLCTSLFEGFPNTFLQAWSSGIPVISTVDPSGIIAENKLGEVVSNEEELFVALNRMLSDAQYYKNISTSITKFFKENHTVEVGYERLINYLKI